MEVVGERASVTPLELFFDLVFVFALTQVTALMARESTVTVTAVARGALILTVLWWCWVAYAWLCNVVRADEGVTRAAMFGAMGGMFVAAITIPEAFNDLPGGLHRRPPAQPRRCSGSPRWSGTTSAPSWPARTGG